MKRPIRENLDGVNSISYYTGQLEEYIDWLEKRVKDLEVACCYNDVYPCVHIEED